MQQKILALANVIGAVRAAAFVALVPVGLITTAAMVDLYELPPIPFDQWHYVVVGLGPVLAAVGGFYTVRFVDRMGRDKRGVGASVPPSRGCPT